MKLHAAALYDIENLVGGVERAERSAPTSLVAVHEAILAHELVEGLAVQRAYANWTDSRLALVRRDIVRLGIDPIQMFGFGRGRSRNAADIQLAVDAMDLVHTRPGLETFVIVSADGGFTCLATRLRGYGRQVIGCAPRSDSSRIFQAVCDAFIEISDVLDRIDSPGRDAIKVPRHPLVTRLAPALGSPIPGDRDEMLDLARTLMDRLVEDPEGKKVLVSGGLNISVIHELMCAVNPQFDPTGLGFASLVDMLRYLQVRGDLRLTHREPR